MKFVSTMVHQHDLSLVIVAGVLCLFGSWVTSRLFGHARNRTGYPAAAWYMLTAVTAGIAIWCTHFVAVLGFQPDVPVSFDLALTFTSLLIAVLGSLTAFMVAATPRLPYAPAIGGAVVGLAVTGGHFAGGVAYRVQGAGRWGKTYLAGSGGPAEP